MGSEKPMINKAEELPAEQERGRFPSQTKGFSHCIDRSERAYRAILRLSEEHGEVNVIALGPLTNFALALLRDKTFADRIGQFRALGGTLYASGPIDFNKERNFQRDPESAFIVKKHVKKIMLITWEVVNELKQDYYLCEKLDDLLRKGGRKKHFLQECGELRNW